MYDGSISPPKVVYRPDGSIDETIFKRQCDGFMVHHGGINLLSETDPKCGFAESATHFERLGFDKDFDAEHVALKTYFGH